MHLYIERERKRERETCTRVVAIPIMYIHMSTHIFLIYIYIYISILPARLYSFTMGTRGLAHAWHVCIFIYIYIYISIYTHRDKEREREQSDNTDIQTTLNGYTCIYTWIYGKEPSPREPSPLSGRPPRALQRVPSPAGINLRITIGSQFSRNMRNRNFQ